MIQLYLLKSYCKEYDAGKWWNALPMSVVLRVLVKDTKNCHSLLTQLGIKGPMQFVDSAHRVKNRFCCWTVGNNIQNMT